VDRCACCFHVASRLRVSQLGMLLFVVIFESSSTKQILTYVSYIKYSENVLIHVLTVEDDELNVGDNEATRMRHRGLPRTLGVTWMGGKFCLFVCGSRVSGQLGTHVP